MRPALQRERALEDEDLGAIYDYLKTVKPDHALVNAFPDAKPSS